jgi:peptidoglycan/xylan/chitin deacetylase (PgdA/CDA1 family)
MKTKPKKEKIIVNGTEDPAPLTGTFEVVSTSRSAENKLGIISSYKKYWILLIIIVLAGIVAFLSQTWLARSLFSLAKTYPGVSVLGTSFGDLDEQQLIDRLHQINPGFQAKKVTLSNGADQWAFDFSKLGVSIDALATAKAVLELNNLNLIDKYKLYTGGISSSVEPVVAIDDTACIEPLSTIQISDTAPIDATVYYDQAPKITPEQSGKKYSPILTCQDLSVQLATGKTEANVSFEITPANISSAELEPKIPEIQSIIGAPLSLSKGSYSKVLAPEQLLALLDITKNDSGVQVSWSLSRLDDLVNAVASDVNTYNGSPALGSCQRLISSGGIWLDKTTTKNYIMGIKSDSSRTYALPVDYYGPTIKDMSPVSSGGSGVIYLTFDDGMTYANQIMNYAGCYGIKVTFFEIGNRAGTDAAALSRAVSEGHAVQSHGYEHALYDYGSRSYDWQFNDIKQSIDAITAITGVRPTYFRPPGGNKSSLTYDAAAANGVTLIMWGDASRDSAPGGVTASLTCTNVLSGAYNGASVLMHSTNKSTAEALPCIIEGLAARGYSMQALR